MARLVVEMIGVFSDSGRDRRRNAKLRVRFKVPLAGERATGYITWFSARRIMTYMGTGNNAATSIFSEIITDSGAGITEQHRSEMRNWNLLPGHLGEAALLPLPTFLLAYVRTPANLLVSPVKPLYDLWKHMCRRSCVGIFWYTHIFIVSNWRKSMRFHLTISVAISFKMYTMQ